MKIWIITWKHYDNSGHGVLSTAYQDEAMADHVFGILTQQCDTKLYEMEEINLLKPEEKKIDDTYLRTQHKTPPWFDLIGVPGTPLSALHLAVRTENCLKAEGVDTVEKLLLCPENIILRFPNLGRRYLNEIKESLAARGLELKK